MDATKNPEKRALIVESNDQSRENSIPRKKWSEEFFANWVSVCLEDQKTI